MGVDSFFFYKGIYISKKYRIIDSVPLPHTKGTEVLVLSPINLEDFGVAFPCYLQTRRVLMVYGDSVRYITDNVVLNRYEFLDDPYQYGETLKETANGFTLFFTAGLRIKCDITLNFALKTDKIYLEGYRTFYYDNGSHRRKDRNFKFKPERSHELDRIKTLSLLNFPRW